MLTIQTESTVIAKQSEARARSALMIHRKLARGSPGSSYAIDERQEGRTDDQVST